MPPYRQSLPQLTDRLFIADGGIETTLMFRDGFDLPHFAAFTLLSNVVGYQALERYFRSYIAIAQTYQVGLVLESATWRANPDWAAKLGYSSADLGEINRQAIALLHDLRQTHETPQTPIVISGCLGPRGDGYVPTAAMTAKEAAAYHRPQIDSFREAGGDLVSAITMNYVEEAVGIVQAAQAAEMPVVISFTVETDGKLPTGQPLGEAIEQVDRASDRAPAYYMINCAHPTHFGDALAEPQPWMARIRGLRANASTKSHAELDEATELDAGNPAELGQQYRALKAKLTNLNVMGGCCGTDDRHIEAICRACLPLAWAHLTQNSLAGIGA